MVFRRSEFDAWPLDLDSTDWGRQGRRNGCYECLVAVLVGVVAVPAGLGADAVGDVEGGLVLGESSGGGVPGSRCRSGRGSVAEGVGDCVGLVEAGGAGPHAQIGRESVFDGTEFLFKLGPPRDHGGSS